MNASACTMFPFVILGKSLNSGFKTLLLSKNSVVKFRTKYAFIYIYKKYGSKFYISVA